MGNVYKIKLRGSWSHKQVEAFLRDLGCPTDGMGWDRILYRNYPQVSSSIYVMPEKGLDWSVFERYPVKSVVPVKPAEPVLAKAI